MKENRILVLTLICLNWLTANAQVSTYTLPSNKEQIDNLCQNDAEYAEKVRTEQMKQNHWDLFAKNNLASNEASFTNEDNSNPALVNGNRKNTIWEIDGVVYRMPTASEMSFIAAPYKLGPKDEMPLFNKSSKLYNNLEFVKIGHNGGKSFYSDYISKGKNTIYALRFKDNIEKKGEDNPDRWAYRYDLSETKLTVTMKYIGADSRIKKVKDIDDDEWWNGQTGKQVIVLPVYSGGVSYYINNEEFLNINNETVTISSQRMSTCFIRPFVDIEKTYKKNMTYMHYNIYGENIKTDKSSDTEKVYQISPANPVIQVYAKGNPNAPLLKYDDAILKYGIVEKKSEDGGVSNYEIKLNKNLGIVERNLEFTMVCPEDERHNKTFTVCQPILNIENIPDSIPSDFISEDYLDQEGSFMTSHNNEPGVFSFDDANMKACLNDGDHDFHLPTMNNMNCIFPSSDKKFDTRYETEDTDTLQFGMFDKAPYAAKSSYFCKGDGLIYALRFKNSWLCSAFRYKFDPQNGLYVSIVPLGSQAYLLKNAREISDGEIFDRKECQTFLFKNLKEKTSEIGDGGALWTSTKDPYDPDYSAFAIGFDKKKIYRTSVAQSCLLPVLPFIGKVEVTEKEIEPTEDTDTVVTVQPRIRRTNRSSGSSRNRSNNQSGRNNTTRTGSNHILIIDKTK